MNHLSSPFLFAALIAITNCDMRITISTEDVQACRKECTGPDAGIVCGSDGRNYGGQCTLKIIACAAKRNNWNQFQDLTVAKEGPCGEQPHCCRGDCYEYRGKESKTMNGKTCQRWDEQTPHRHVFTSKRYPNAGLDENYCRNPSGARAAWCYTKDNATRWEYCLLPTCRNYWFNESCCVDKTCVDFRGEWAKTLSGRSCKPWTATRFQPKKYPDFGLDSNYCRNPSGHNAPWCYTTDPRKRWENCGVDRCPEKENYSKAEPFRKEDNGVVNIRIAGIQ